MLTDDGLHFTDPRGTSWIAAEIKELIARKQPFRAHAFEYTCATTDIDRRLTKPKHPWTNGQVERMNRTIKDATVKRFYYEKQDQALKPSRPLRHGLQLRQTPQDPQRPHAI